MTFSITGSQIFFANFVIFARNERKTGYRFTVPTNSVMYYYLIGSIFSPIFRVRTCSYSICIKVSPPDFRHTLAVIGSSPASVVLAVCGRSCCRPPVSLSLTWKSTWRPSTGSRRNLFQVCVKMFYAELKSSCCCWAFVITRFLKQTCYNFVTRRVRLGLCEKVQN